MRLDFKLATIFVTSVTLLAGVGCTSKDDPAPNGIRFNHPIPLAEGVQLTGAEATLKTKIDGRQVLSYTELTDRFFDMHVASYEERTSTDFPEEDLKTFLSTLSESATSSLGPFDLKTNYEAKMEAIFSPHDYDYLLGAVSLPDIMQENAAQCYSGTSLFQVLSRRQFNEQQFMNTNQLVIMEAGHVLPGFMMNTPEGWRLYGVETTVGGRGEVDYGLAKDISEPIRVVDANDWIVVEIFKRHMDKDKTAAMVTSIVSATGNKYGIPWHSLEQKIKGGTGQIVQSAKRSAGGDVILSQGNWSPDIINSSPLSFGRADVSSVRKVREKAYRLSPRGSHSFKPSNFSILPKPPVSAEVGLSEEEGHDAFTAESDFSVSDVVVDGTSPQMAVLMLAILESATVNKKGILNYQETAGSPSLFAKVEEGEHPVYKSTNKRSLNRATTETMLNVLQALIEKHPNMVTLSKSLDHLYLRHLEELSLSGGVSKGNRTRLLILRAPALASAMSRTRLGETPEDNYGLADQMRLWSEVARGESSPKR